MNSSIPTPSVVAQSVLPTTNTLIPAGVALAVLAPLTCIIDLPPLIWHIRNRNVAAGSLVAWIIFHNLLSFINLLIWPTDNFEGKYNGEGLCDVEVKFMVARAVALPAAALCIIRALANVMNTEKSLTIPTKTQRRRTVVMDLVFCMGLPLVMMLFHYIVQPNRYFLAGVSGCTPSFWSSWLSILLMSLPPLFLSLASAYYGSMVLYRLHKYRSNFHSILATSNTTKSRFFRLFAISTILTIGLLPVEIYVLTTNLPNPNFNGSFHWDQVHNADTWRIIVLYHSAVFYDRWVNIVCGFLVFFLFGMGRDAMKMYCKWLVALGFGKCSPALVRGSGQSSKTATQQTSGSGKAKPFDRARLASSGSKNSTLVSGEDVDAAFPSKSIHATSKSLPFNKISNPSANLAADAQSQSSSNRTFISKLIAPFRRRPLPSSDPELQNTRVGYPMVTMNAGPSKGTVDSGVWSEHGSQKALAQKGMLPDGEVLVMKEIRRGSEGV